MAKGKIMHPAIHNSNLRGILLKQCYCVVRTSKKGSLNPVFTVVSSLHKALILKFRFRFIVVMRYKKSII